MSVLDNTTTNSSNNFILFISYLFTHSHATAGEQTSKQKSLNIGLNTVYD